MLLWFSCLLVAAVLPAGAGARNVDTIFSTNVVMHFTYNIDCTFSIHVDATGNGIDIPAATTTIPPGTYVLQVGKIPDTTFDPATCGNGANFSLTGPGLNWSVTIGAFSGGGGTMTATLAPSSTYTAVDLSRPDSKISFSTAAAGNSQSLLPPIPTGPTTTVEESQSELVGSDIPTYRGALQATVSPAGQATLASAGKPLSSLPAGEYSIVVQDKAAASGFFVQKLHQRATTVSTAKFTGKRTVKVSLTAGSWVFYAQSGKATRFVVSA